MNAHARFSAMKYLGRASQYEAKNILWHFKISLFIHSYKIEGFVNLNLESLLSHKNISNIFPCNEINAFAKTEIKCMSYLRLYYLGYRLFYKTSTKHDKILSQLPQL